MTEIAFLDFDLRIERSEEGYTARVLACPAGQASADFDLPFSELELENFVLRIGRARRGMRRLESSEMELVKSFGGRLFDAVFRDDVRACLRSSLDEARRNGKGLRVRLHLDTPELADLPWEYLYNVSLNRFLSLSIETPLVRYLELPERIQPLAVKPPLCVLVMISSPRDCARLEVEQEWTKLKEAVADLEEEGLVTMERLEEATLTGLQRQLRQGAHHIFHFIGHGAFDEQGQDGVLLLEDEEGQSRSVSSQYLGTLLHDERTLRLAVLNACEGARTSRTDPFAGTAQSLVQQGIPAVIAMQSEISDEAAITFAHEFYAALADGYPVDAALAEARKAIFAQGNDIEWGKPVLYLRAPDGRIFDVERVGEVDRRLAQIVALRQQAEKAMARQEWGTAIGSLQAILRLDPEDAEAAAVLIQALRAQELARLYAEGRDRYRAGRQREALDLLRRVQAMQPGYQDVDLLIAAIEREKAGAEAYPWRELFPTGSRRISLPTVLLLLLLVAATAAVTVFLILRPGSGPVAQVATSTETAALASTTTAISTSAATTLASYTGTPKPTGIVPGLVLPVLPVTATATATMTSAVTIPPTAPDTATPVPTTLTLTVTAATPALSGQIFFPVYDSGRQTFDIHSFDLDSGQRQVAVQQASQPAVSQDGLRLVYRSWDSARRGIYVLELDRGNSWQWTPLDKAARPSCSPDGQNIVLSSDHERAGQWRIYRSSGQDFPIVPRQGDGADGWLPVWLAGGRIVHSACSPQGCGLYVMHNDGTNLARLTSYEYDTATAASPDGSQVALMSNRDGNWEIYVVNADGSGLTRLTTNDVRDGLPAWSPDGQWLAFVTYLENRWSVWAMGPDGSLPRELFTLGGSLEGRIARVDDDQQRGWTWETIAWGP